MSVQAAHAGTALRLAQDPKVGSRPFEFAEELVAGGGADDVVTVRHLRLQGSQREIGHKLAEIARDRHGVEPAERDAGTVLERLDYFRSDYPQHYERSLGARDLFGIDVDDPLDTSSLAYNLPARFGCSVVFYPGSHTASGHATLSRNYDFPTASWKDMVGPAAFEPERRNAEDPYVVELYPDTGYASLFLCAYELLGTCLDGINSEGLTVALLANETLANQSSTGAWRPGLNELEIARYLLESCASVEEAREALDSRLFYYMLLPCHYIIGDRSGDSFIWEYSGDLEEIYHVEGRGKPLWATNHPVNEYPSVEDLPDGLTISTYERFRKLNEAVAEAPVKRSVEDMKQANACVKAYSPAPLSVRTLWHGLYDCEERALDVDFYLGADSAGEERRSGYLHFWLER